MHALLQCWFESGICLVFSFPFSSKKKHNFIIWKNDLVFSWFFLFHWYDYRSYGAQSVSCLFIPCIVLVFRFFVGAVSFAGLWRVHRRKREELLPYLTLRRCWGQRLKKRTNRKEARRDLIKGRAAVPLLGTYCQTTVNTNEIKLH